MAFTTRPATPQDRAVRAQLWNTYWPGFLETEEDVIASDQSWPKSAPIKRWIVERDGEPVAVLAWAKMYWVAADGPLMISVMMDDADPDFCKAVRWIEKRALEANPTALRTFGRTDLPQRIALLQSLGYSGMELSPHLKLETAKFDEAPFQDLITEVQRDYRIATFAELEAEGWSWKRPLYDATIEMVEDIPTSEPMQVESYSDYLNGLDAWEYWPPLMYAIMDDDRLVAYSRLKRFRNEPEKTWTAFGGVVRSHRRRGLMTALKAWSIADARDRQGVQLVTTDNVEGNPMRLINDRVGFGHWFDAVKLGRDL